MTKLNLEQIKAIQLTILDVVVDFCERNQISYWLEFGTLIGAVRHKGYIPWDDDIDLGMLRPDYDKFLKTFNESNARYKAYNIENNKKFYYPWIKVMDTETFLVEAGKELGVNIDIFVFDNAPEKKKYLDKMFRRRDFYKIVRSIQFSKNKNKPRGNIVRRIAVYSVRALIKLLPLGLGSFLIARNSKKYSLIKTTKVGNFLGNARVVVDRNILTSFCEKEFEGRFYKVPAQYDTWLRLYYGDYLTLPPLEERMRKHSFDAYIHC